MLISCPYMILETLCIAASTAGDGNIDEGVSDFKAEVKKVQCDAAFIHPFLY